MICKSQQSLEFRLLCNAHLLGLVLEENGTHRPVQHVHLSLRNQTSLWRHGVGQALAMPKLFEETGGKLGEAVGPTNISDHHTDLDLKKLLINTWIDIF